MRTVLVDLYVFGFLQNLYRGYQNVDFVELN